MEYWDCGDRSKMNCTKCENCLKIFHYLVKDKNVVDQDIREMVLRAKEHGCTDHARISHNCKDCSMNDWLRRVSVMFSMRPLGS
jgi:hypothetical protein